MDDIKYIYNDINPITCQNVKTMSNYFKLLDKYFYNQDSAKFIPSEDYEAVFTCPPYFCKEKYSNIGAENYNYNGFLNWWNDTIKSSIKTTLKYFAFVISADLMEDMKNICLNNNLKLLDIIILGSTKQINHFNHQKSKKAEELLIFEV